MDISKYTAYFHDGSLFHVLHKGNKMELSMSSAEMDEEDVGKSIVLSRDNCIQGKLHLEGIKQIKINESLVENELKLLYDNGKIFDFEVSKNSIKLDIIWIDYPPKPEIDEFSTIEIEAEKIWWETIPNLESFS